MTEITSFHLGGWRLTRLTQIPQTHYQAQPSTFHIVMVLMICTMSRSDKLKPGLINLDQVIVPCKGD
jgi:hypothetical protein